MSVEGKWRSQQRTGARFTMVTLNYQVSLYHDGMMAAVE